MKKIDSQMLESLNKALGLSGVGSPVTELTDGIVDQVIDVGPIVRRSRTQANTAGVYTALIRNVHGAGNSLSAGIAPFLGAAAALEPYPSPMPAGFDVWLLSSVVTQSAGTGTVSAALRVDVPARLMGLSSLGASVGAAMNVAFWDTIVDESILFAIKSNQTEPVQKIGLRLPRDPATQLVFSSTSSAAATFDCLMMLGVFPVGLGQDVIV